ncbi:hypothetical protein F4679DRAFT_532076 [Xylaria curta]|nr:hypothetical protein F4679DRAFT_532076 [Xylaria curta]
MSAYTFAPLDHERKEIRLLQIHPSTDKSSNVVCSLQHVSLNVQNPPHYEALSYTWGGGPTSDHMILDDEHFAMRDNLRTALTALRLSNEARVM